MILIQRAESSLQRAQQLNPMVQVTADSEDISNKSDSFFKDFDLVVATNCSADQLVGYILCLRRLVTQNCVSLSCFL